MRWLKKPRVVVTISLPIIRSNNCASPLKNGLMGEHYVDELLPLFYPASGNTTSVQLSHGGGERENIIVKFLC